MSSHVLLKADKVSTRGFTDVTEHRQALPAIYNYYTNTAQDPAITPDTEELVSIFRPLFNTSYLINDLLVDRRFFNATQLLVISASSKTAQALACLLAWQGGQRLHNSVGLTSPRNQDFVRRLGWYDQVMNYDELAEIDTHQKTIIVDFSGNHHIQAKLQNLLKENLVYNCHVGFTDWENLEGETPLPKKPEFFFAPAQGAKRRKELGLPKFMESLRAAWQYFINSIQSKISIEKCIGPEQFERLYEDMLQGKIDPQRGNIISFKRECQRS